MPALIHAVESEHPLTPKGLARRPTTAGSGQISDFSGFLFEEATFNLVYKLLNDRRNICCSYEAHGFQKHLHLPQSSEPEASGSPVKKCPELAIDVRASDMHHVKGPMIATWYAYCPTCQMLCTLERRLTSHCQNIDGQSVSERVTMNVLTMAKMSPAILSVVVPTQ